MNDLQEILSGEEGAEPIFAALDASSDPGNPTVHLESGCNEMWLDVAHARALIEYLTRKLPLMGSGET